MDKFTGILTIIIVVVVAVVALVVTSPSKDMEPVNTTVADAELGTEELTPTDDTEDDMPFRFRKKTYNVTMSTSMGDVVIEMYGKQTPKTVENFLTLASEGFYDGTRFHRVIDGFMIQGGDPRSRDEDLREFWGTGDPGYKFEDEFVGRLENEVGYISMANSGPNTNGSQFFINLVDNHHLDGKHTVFGRVIEGMDVVEAIGKTPVNDDFHHVPVDDVFVTGVTFTLAE